MLEHSSDFLLVYTFAVILAGYYFIYRKIKTNNNLVGLLVIGSLLLILALSLLTELFIYDLYGERVDNDFYKHYFRGSVVGTITLSFIFFVLGRFRVLDPFRISRSSDPIDFLLGFPVSLSIGIVIWSSNDLAMYLFKMIFNLYSTA